MCNNIQQFSFILLIKKTMYKITTNNEVTFVTITSTFTDKETNTVKEFNNKYKVAQGVNPVTIKERLDNQNPDFLNKNIKEYLLPAGIVTDSGNKKLIGDMLSQMA